MYFLGKKITFRHYYRFFAKCPPTLVPLTALRGEGRPPLLGWARFGPKGRNLQVRVHCWGILSRVALLQASAKLVPGGGLFFARCVLIFRYLF